MKIVTNPKGILSAKGKSFIAKQMLANTREFSPKHRASVESVLLVMLFFRIANL